MLNLRTFCFREWKSPQGLCNRSKTCTKKMQDNLDVLNRSSRFAAIRIATGSQRFQIARFESQGQKPFESLFNVFPFCPFRYCLFLVGTFKRPRTRKRTNRHNPRKNRENPRKIGKVPKGQKGTKKQGQVQIGNQPCLNPLDVVFLFAVKSLKIGFKSREMVRRVLRNVC